LDKPGAATQSSGKNCELYDLLADPAEAMNLAAQKPRIVEELWAMLQQVRNRT
jgi:hypothetical protein